MQGLFWARDVCVLELTSICNRPGENRPATGYFSLPGGMFTSLVPGDDLKSPWSLSFLLGEEFTFPGSTYSRDRKKNHEFVSESLSCFCC